MHLFSGDTALVVQFHVNDNANGLRVDLDDVAADSARGDLGMVQFIVSNSAFHRPCRCSSWRSTSFMDTDNRGAIFIATGSNLLFTFLVWAAVHYDLKLELRDSSSEPIHKALARWVRKWWLDRPLFLVQLGNSRLEVRRSEGYRCRLPPFTGSNLRYPALGNLGSCLQETPVSFHREGDTLGRYSHIRSVYGVYQWAYLIFEHPSTLTIEHL